MVSILKSETDINNIKARNLFVAFLCSFFFPGLGQMYNGQLKKGLLFFTLLFIALPLFFVWGRLLIFFQGYIAFILLHLFFRIYFIVDSIIIARRNKEYYLKWFNRWPYYSLFILLGFACYLLIDVKKLSGVTLFKIPTSSNEPSLFAGDYVLADFKAFNNEEPDYGDMVVYKMNNGVTYTHRVVGKPNDALEIQNNIITINEKICATKILRDVSSEEGWRTEFEEILPNNYKHLTYKNKTETQNKNANLKASIPSNCFLLLGDNRDNSMDSRYVGFVHKDSIVGQLRFVLWGTAKFKRMNVKL